MSDASPSPSATSRRADRSCVVCHRRKVRCDKKSPCSQCARGKYACFYPQAGPPARRARKATITDVASRIIEIERSLMAVTRDRGAELTISTLSQTQSVEKSGSFTYSTRVEQNRHQEILLRKGTSIQYFDEVLMSRVIEQEHDVRSVLSTPNSPPSHPLAHSSPFNVMGILSARCIDEPLANYLPSKTIAMKLWGAFVNYVDSCAKVLHLPTVEVDIFMAINDPSTVSTDTLALCFAVFYSAMLALDTADMLGLSQEEVYNTLLQYKLGLEQAFAHGDFLENPTVEMLQALTIYLVSVRVHNVGRGVWTLNGLAIRAAQSIGLHRDGKVLNLSPFESEVRRRLWWRLIALDGRAAEDYGLHTMSEHGRIMGVDLPLNIEDTDIFPEMKELPPARPGYTRMTLALVHIEIARAWSRLQHFRSPTGTISESFRQRVVNDAIGQVNHMLSQCNDAVPTQRMVHGVARFILRKLELVSRQRDKMNETTSEEMQTFAIEEHLIEAVQLLEESNRLWSDEFLKPYRWSMQAYRQFQMMLYIVWYLCVRPHGPHSERALRVVEESMGNERSMDEGATCDSKWRAILALKDKANAIVEAARKGNSQSITKSSQSPEEARVAANLALWNKTADGNGEQEIDGLQGVLDWRTLLEDFQYDPNGLSIV